jgi:hypothetical protein
MRKTSQKGIEASTPTQIYTGNQQKIHWDRGLPQNSPQKVAGVHPIFADCHKQNPSPINL